MYNPKELMTSAFKKTAIIGQCSIMRLSKKQENRDYH